MAYLNRYNLLWFSTDIDYPGTWNGQTILYPGIAATVNNITGPQRWVNGEWVIACFHSESGCPKITAGAWRLCGCIFISDITVRQLLRYTDMG